MKLLREKVFVQIGATRDGLDPYLYAARRRGMKAVLVDTPEYIDYRRLQRRHEFDFNIAINRPTDIADVAKELTANFGMPSLILPGFERYVGASYKLAQKLRVLPWRQQSTPFFVPPDKIKQRYAIRKNAPTVLQPNFIILSDFNLRESDLTNLTYPLVIKPADGGGGLGIKLARNYKELEMALEQLQKTRNYDGGEFAGVIVEEYIRGIECSIQGIARRSIPDLLTFSEKYIAIEASNRLAPPYGFREVGHVAVTGNRVSSSIRELANQVLRAVGYSDGPFHIDLIHSAKGWYILEMGFRLSGFGLVDLVRRTANVDWADESLAWHLGLPPVERPIPPSSGCVGQISAVSPDELAAAQGLLFAGKDVEIFTMENQVDFPSNVPAALKADLNRHRGTVGWIRAAAPTIKGVKEMLSYCSPQRAVMQQLDLKGEIRCAE